MFPVPEKVNDILGVSHSLNKSLAKSKSIEGFKSTTVIYLNRIKTRKWNSVQFIFHYLLGAFLQLCSTFYYPKTRQKNFVPKANLSIITAEMQENIDLINLPNVYKINPLFSDKM